MTQYCPLLAPQTRLPKRSPILGSLVWGAKSGQYCVIGGGSLQMVSEPLPSLRWWERAQANEGRQRRRWVQRGGWLWCRTSPVNEDVLICINAPFMIQRVLKPWWSWTYQNSEVKRASARAIPGWVTSWEVWFGESKADNIVSLRVSHYTFHLWKMCCFIDCLLMTNPERHLVLLEGVLRVIFE